MLGYSEFVLILFGVLVENSLNYNTENQQQMCQIIYPRVSDVYLWSAGVPGDRM